VLAAVAEMLTELGYRVLKAKNADSALAILESGAPVDLLFTDVVMPGAIRSPELARRARERLPGIAVLFTSGYTQNAIVHGGRLDDGVDLLSKPYSREQLARKLRHVMRNQQQRNDSQPSASQPVAAKQNVRAHERSVRRLRVLLVEDDEFIRPVTAEMLKVLGYSVLQAANAADAIGLLEAHRVDVLLTDIGLPGTSGEELAAEACRRRPDLRVVFASGYDEMPKCQRDVVGKAIFLRKPYSEERLSRALNSAIR
jgi:CheY-like chemotaxis protein